MLTVTRKVYYCEFCKRHRMTAAAIEKHEPRCIYNPLRSECGWHKGMKPSAPADFALVFKDSLDIDWLRKEMDGCPACMLAVVVQAGLGGAAYKDTGFDYADEVARYRESERSADVY